MAIIAEMEERLLRLTDFEDIITCLKSDPAQWADDKLRGILTAAYLSSVSEDELTLASESVTAAAAESMLGNAAAALAPDSGPEGAAAGSGDAGAGNGAVAAPARAGAAAEGGSPDLATAAAHHRAASNAEALDELVRSELTHLTWAEAATEVESPAEAAAGAEALMKSLRRGGSDGAKVSPARRKSVGPATEMVAAGAAAPVDATAAPAADAGCADAGAAGADREEAPLLANPQDEG